MPVRNLIARKPNEARQQLVREIVNEWRFPSEDASQPIIIPEQSSTWSTRHVFVVWDKWEGIDQTERSEIIMDACEEHLGRDETLKVTVAMGLTKTEAQRMKINYEEVGK